MKFFAKFLFFFLYLMLQFSIGHGQELLAKVAINHSQIQGTDESVFTSLQKSIEQFLNDRQWTSLIFQKNERINCSFNITITKYDKDNNQMTARAIIQANRPVYNSAYTTTIYNNTDNNFNFDFSQFDQLNFTEATIDNQLTALLAYYALLIIGTSQDTFAPMGGEEILQRCFTLVNNAQSLSFTGWKSFEDSRNRFAIINDYLDEGMKPLRQLQYDYYRTGLDEMQTNTARGRANITKSLESNLKKAHENKPLSVLPQIWTDFKKDELVNIYHSQGTKKEKQAIYDLLIRINASQNTSWEKILR